MSKSRDQNLPDLDYIRELAKVFKRYELDEIEIESGDQRVLLRRGDLAPGTVPMVAATPVVTGAPAAAPAPAAAVASQPAASVPPPPSTPEPEPELEAEGAFITSPFVGTFYRAPRPDAPSFVDIGDRVEAGTTVCVVEAMKLFNEIEAEEACIIEEVLVGNAQAVEFGTKLFRVRKP
ncbi:acetyl-CoA carboxylase biotin carboxyl carrier protein [Paraliomyxa miuraensis]|uniref:acetyl-CoA carboxylase biotin carboxyl carrier protein n=1 Tax=Paraliomyxa miuraensis TaxID=376150 RepID=UPI002255FD39|nr:acetyl-CoA carboxylase biotin carboxyl carrier protein [Paraliomyxa miuraensis]MCX4240287.1 acetyl-CoA carboxylase biotin carboxyl carrier protein [Paraliomyxa miuraensis]